MKRIKAIAAAIVVLTITVFASCKKDEVKPVKTIHQNAIMDGTGGGETPPQLPPHP